mgnify:CR=1 FL=1
MERVFITKAILEVSRYSESRFDPVKFLTYCGAQFKYLGKKQGGMLEYYAILSMELPDEFTIDKTEGKEWWVLTGNAGAVAYIELDDGVRVELVDPAKSFKAANTPKKKTKKKKAPKKTKKPKREPDPYGLCYGF